MSQQQIRDGITGTEKVNRPDLIQELFVPVAVVRSRNRNFLSLKFKPEKKNSRLILKQKAETFFCIIFNYKCMTEYNKAYHNNSYCRPFRTFSQTRTTIQLYRSAIFNKLKLFKKRPITCNWSLPGFSPQVQPLIMSREGM
jgi:hypothetical protein